MNIKKASFVTLSATAIAALLCLSMGTSKARGGAQTQKPATSLRGVYASKNWLKVSPGWTSRIYTFYPDGRVYNDIPPEGSMSDATFAQQQRETPERCGRYTINGNEITLIWGGKRKSETVSFQQQDADLFVDRVQWYYVTPVSQLRLNGNYVYAENPDANASLTFSPDGSYQRVWFNGQKRPGDTGTYRIYDYTLEMSGSDGSHEKHSFFIYPDSATETSPRMIVVKGEAMLLRQPR